MNLQRGRHGARWLIFAGILVLLFLVLAWLHRRYVVTPIDYANRDFMSLWTGGLALLRDLNPYDLEVWRPLRAAHGSTWMPDPRAPFPLWTFLFTAPFALLPLPAGAAAWLVFSEYLLALDLYLLVGRLYRYRPSVLDVALLTAGAFASISTVLVLINGQMTYLLLGILAVYLLLTRRERPFWAGFALSFIALKPNPFILFAPLIGLRWLRYRRWANMAGAAAGGLTLLAASWLVQPGWLWAWLNVRSKTEVVEITPTLWGLAAELAPDRWLPLGLILTVAVAAGVGYYLFSREELPEMIVISLALAGSLVTTPYAWTYEHALLFIPWLWLFVTPSQRMGRLSWLVLTWLLPWLLFLLAAARGRETLSVFVPLLTAAAVFWLFRRRSGLAAA